VACVQASIRGRAVVRRSERLGGEDPVRRAPKAGEPAREGDNGEFLDHQSGSRDGRVGLAPSREPTEQHKPTPRVKADVVTQGRPGQVPTRLRYSHGTTDGPLQLVLRTGGRDIPDQRNSALTSPSPMRNGRSRRRGGRTQPGLVFWADGSRDENGAVGYAVVWKNGRSSGPGGRPAWDSFRRHTTRSVPPLRAP